MMGTPATISQKDADDMLERIVRFYETLSPTSLADLGSIYEADARFKDPFNDVVGLDSIRAIFFHMFATMGTPRFVVMARSAQQAQCFLTWEFRFSLASIQGGREQCIHGATHLVLSTSGRVSLHRDYWDAAEELYEKVPLLGGLMRWLKRKLATPGT